MKFSEMKKQAQDMVREHRNKMKKDGSKFIVSEAPLLAFDDGGRLEEKGYSMDHSDGQSGKTLSELTKKQLDEAIAEVIETLHKQDGYKAIDLDTVGLSLFGTMRGYDSLRDFRDDEFESDRGEFDITVWTLKDGIVCNQE